jgi:hypothetical protein
MDLVLLNIETQLVSLVQTLQTEHFMVLNYSTLMDQHGMVLEHLL